MILVIHEVANPPPYLLQYFLVPSPIPIAIYCNSIAIYCNCIIVFATTYTLHANAMHVCISVSVLVWRMA